MTEAVLGDINKNIEVGDVVEYKTCNIRTIHGGYRPGIIKRGIVIEAFSTFDNTPCYWIKDEKELILHGQIRRIICKTES